jgi:hypothetical protein
MPFSSPAWLILAAPKARRQLDQRSFLVFPADKPLEVE